MISGIEIKDVAGGVAPGCTASFVIESGQVGYTTYSYIVATATPAAGYVFLRWEHDYYIQTLSSSQSEPTYHYGVQVDENPSAHRIYDYETDNPFLGIHGVRVTTRLVAIFRKTTPPPPPGTGLILRSASSGMILRGASGSVLYDG